MQSARITSYEVVRLLKQTDNRLCADCSAPLTSPLQTFASLTHGVWICSLCADIHREYLPQSELKCSTESWSAAETLAMQQAISNTARNAVLERYQPIIWEKITPEASEHERKQWIRAKYYSHFFAIPQETVPGAEERERGNHSNNSKSTANNNNNKLKKKAPKKTRTKQQERQARIESLTALPARLADYLLVLGPGKVKHALSASRRASLASPAPLTLTHTHTAESAPAQLLEETEFHVEVLDCYPERDWHADTPLPELVGPMVFPQGLRLSSAERAPHCFSFVLTDVNRVKLYGTTLVVHELLEPEEITELFSRENHGDGQCAQGTNAVLYAPKALTILSHYAFFHLFSLFLSQTYHLSLSQSPLPLERFVLNFMEELPLPPQGRTEVSLSLPQCTLLVSRPPVNQLPMVDFSFQPLFSLLHVDTVLAVFHALCLEMSVCFCCSNIALLTPVQEALLSLLFPFVWQGCYVPILPDHMLELLDAPVPLLVGVHDKIVRERDSPTLTHTHNVLFVHVDRDELFFTAEGERAEYSEREREKERERDSVYLPPSLAARLARNPLPKSKLAKLRQKLTEYASCVYRPTRSPTPTHTHTQQRERELSDVWRTAGCPFPQNEHLVPMRDFVFEQGALSTTQHSGAAQYSTAQLASSLNKLGVRRQNAPTQPSVGSSAAATESSAASSLSNSNTPQSVKFSSPGNATLKSTKHSIKTITAVPYRHPAACTLVVASTRPLPKSPLDPENNYDGSESVNHFNAKEIREAFLRFFVASFGDYQDFLRTGSDGTVFDSDGFIAAAQDEFLTSMVRSQMFTNFIQERSESPDTPEIKFFDENLLAKKNRSKLSLSKASTPFLSDDTHYLREVYTAPGPSSAGLTIEESNRGFAYPSFPLLQCEEPRHADTVRPAKVLVSQEERERKRKQDRGNQAANFLEQQIALLLSNASSKYGGNNNNNNINNNNNVQDNETVITTAEQESSFLEYALDRYVSVCESLSRFQRFVRDVRRLRRRFVAMRRAQRTIWAWYRRWKRERTRRYKIFVGQIVRIQRHVRGFLVREKVKRFMRVLVKLQSRWRKLQMLRIYRKTRSKVVLIQKTYRGHNTRVKAFALRSASLALYRSQLPLLWTLSYTPLLQRSLFWLSVREPTFLCVSLCERELRRLYRQLGFSSKSLSVPLWEKLSLAEQAQSVQRSAVVQNLRAVCEKHTLNNTNNNTNKAFKAGETIAWKELVPDLYAAVESISTEKKTTTTPAASENERKEREELYATLQTYFSGNNSERDEQEKKWFELFQVTKHKFRKRKLSRYVWMKCDDLSLCELSARVMLSLSYAPQLAGKRVQAATGFVDDAVLQEVTKEWFAEQRRESIAQHTVETIHAFLRVLQELKRENYALRVRCEEEKRAREKTAL